MKIEDVNNYYYSMFNFFTDRDRVSLCGARSVVDFLLVRVMYIKYFISFHL